ncbi:MAG: hypothetical protein IT561_21595 [Alphaproteobacteria bacterium]|nr:hypothetical protein [Alphaproteobacteria bacterium]
MTAVQGAVAAPACVQPTGFLSRLLAMWRADRRDAVEAALAGQGAVPRWRLTLDAVRFIRRFEADGTAPPPGQGLREQALVLDALVAFGPLAAARAFAAATSDAASLPTGLAGLWTMVLHAPDAPPGDFLDDPALDVQVAARAGARDVVFVFTGGAHRFNAPVGLAHHWFGRLDASVVYLRDFGEMHYLTGIGSLGDGYRAAIGGLGRIAASLNATRVACAGSSSGSYGAMRYALDLGADRVLCLAGPSVLDESLPQLLARAARRGGAAEPIDPARLDLAVLYAETARPPRLRILFGADNPLDRREAENMARVPGVELAAMPGVASHGVMPPLVADGTFDRHLDWLVPVRSEQRGSTAIPACTTNPPEAL